jgi:hypothetical protein
MRALKVVGWVLCMGLLAACGPNLTDAERLELTLGRELPVEAENVQITWKRAPGNTSAYWVRFDVSEQVSDKFLTRLDIKLAQSRRRGETFDPTATYHVVPPNWWFDGFEEDMMYQTDVDQPGPEDVRILTWVDDRDAGQRRIFMSIRDWNEK